MAWFLSKPKQLQPTATRMANALSKTVFNADLLVFAQKTKNMIIEKVESEISLLQNVRVQFGLQAGFSINRNGQIQTMSEPSTSTTSEELRNILLGSLAR